MTFLAIASQKSLLTLQKSQLEFEQQMLTCQATWLQKEMNYVTKVYNSMEDDNSKNYTDDPYYLDLEQKEEQIQTEIQNLDDQVKFLEQAISSDKTLVQNNIKSSCGLNITSG